MRATKGDTLHVHSRTVGVPAEQGEIVEVRGKNGEPPYLVRFADGREALVFPGSDSVVKSSR